MKAAVVRNAHRPAARAQAVVPTDGVDLFMDGRLPLDRLVSRRYTLDSLATLFDDLEGGRLTKGVVTF